MKGSTETWATVKGVISEILEDVDLNMITENIRLQELGANSVDRVEIVITSMEQLNLQVPLTAFSNVNNVGDLVRTLDSYSAEDCTTSLG